MKSSATPAGWLTPQPTRAKRRTTSRPSKAIWATPQHRDILDACKAGDRDKAAALLAGHLARTGLEVSELLDPTYAPELLRTAVVDAGGELPVRQKRKRARG